MRAKCFIIFTVIVILLIATPYTNASAMKTGFDIEPISSENAKKIFDNINLKYENEEAYHHSIDCFDVSGSGLIAVGIDEDIEKHINIYNSDGIFQYGYSFKDSGTYGIEFDNDNLIIYFVRGDDACLIDEEGNLIEMCTIANTAENNRYWQQNVFAKSRNVGSDKYVLSKVMIFYPSYSKLTKISSDGTESVMIDVSADSFIYMIIVIFIAIIVIGISILSVINNYKSN